MTSGTAQITPTSNLRRGLPVFAYRNRSLETVPASGFHRVYSQKAIDPTYDTQNLLPDKPHER